MFKVLSLEWGIIAKAVMSFWHDGFYLLIRLKFDIIKKMICIANSKLLRSEKWRRTGVYRGAQGCTGARINRLAESGKVCGTQGKQLAVRKESDWRRF